jgi:hypothetical protein
MKFYLLSFPLAICMLIAGGTAYFSPPAAALTNQSIDLTSAVDQFFKKGTLKESWFAPSKQPGGFPKFRKQALGARQQAFKTYGAYQSVRNEGEVYIASFAKGEVRLKFELNEQGRIASINLGAK